MPKKVQASHILVKTESEVNVIYFDVTHGSSFEKTAMEKSICPSRKRGGDLGWFGRGQMVKEFENAAFSMEKGQISRPVKTQFGWHIIKLTDIQ